MHDLQNLAVALIVIGCTAYAAWALMPATWRRGLAVQALRVPGSERLGGITTWLRKRAVVDAGCGCSGCDSPARPTPKEVPIRIHRR